jgi:hypothetical protein
LVFIPQAVVNLNTLPKFKPFNSSIILWQLTVFHESAHVRIVPEDPFRRFGGESSEHQHIDANEQQQASSSEKDHKTSPCGQDIKYEFQEQHTLYKFAESMPDMEILSFSSSG